ncbi:MAG: amidohydrolase family protein [Dehalococcoidales bacterium]|nr:amidohydrolase family protein [Dehalococcoidales bacterium]
MPAEIKAVDCLILCPMPRNLEEQAAEEATGKGGVLSLFPGLTERLVRGLTHDELVKMMDEAGVEKGLVSIHSEKEHDWVRELRRKYPGKFLARFRVNPIANGIMNEVRTIKKLVKEEGLQIITITGYFVGVPCTDARLFPLYSLAVEYDLKVCIAVGYPGPAGFARTQSPLYVDEICYLFPEMKVVQTHLGHPWVEEAIHNVIKYPNCYLQTNEYRPKYFPPEFIHHLNSRAQDKVMWASGHPTITFQTSINDVKALPIRDDVRPKFLRDNALCLYKF